MTSQQLTVRPETVDLVAPQHIAVAIAALSNQLAGELANQPLIWRLPTAQERARLHERQGSIRSLTRAAMESVASRERISRAVGEMLGGWLNLRVTNAPEVIAGFTVKLQELPAWAVSEACRDFQEGRATFFDDDGKERRLSSEYAPSAATVYLVARRKLDALYAEAALIDRILRAKLAAPEPDPDMQARVGAMMAELAETMGAKVREDRAAQQALAKKLMAEADERREKFAREADARRLERYHELGIMPVYVGDKLCDADALPPHLIREV